jgi:5-methyltetrahydropteroyltriglutamate--homocysteine methyltransferase
MAIATELRKEVEALVDAGARIIQVDEPAISTRIDELFFAREAMNIITEGIDAYFICHICYGNFAPVFEHMLSLGVDNLDLETSLKPVMLEEFLKENVFDKDISYGVVDVHRHTVETVDEIVATTRQALARFEPNKVWIDPDCGLKTRTVDEAIAKLTNMQNAVNILRKEIPAIS